jgi:preprotein translocase subunit SecA
MPDAVWPGLRLRPRPREAIAPYRERAEPVDNAVDRWLARRLGEAEARLPFRRWALAARTRAVLRLAPAMEAMSDTALKAEAAALRPRLLHGGLRGPALVRAFALVREASGRTLGMRHHPVQIQGAFGLIDGRLVEMATGEGKTLTAAPAAAVAALAGEPVHVVTVNDYLAVRDAASLKPVFDFLGLTVASIDAEAETDARRAAYAADVTFVSNKNLTFDYLRDRIAVGQRRGFGRRKLSEFLAGRPGGGLMLRGLAFAIVDEADSVLVDEARTPLILSATRDDPETAALYARGLGLARTLLPGRHYRVDAMERSVTLSEAGKAAAAQMAEGWGGLWAIRRAREELVTQALSAEHLFALGRDYIVAEDKVQIVDEFTGRVMPDRAWQGGLHQMIEAKEGLAVTGRRETLARITYQRFFRRYRRLAGMTGTALELSGEMLETYGLSTVRIPTHRPSKRRHVGTRFARDGAEKWAWVAARAARQAAEGRPVLIGTRSVEASEAAAAALAVPHVVLNARQDAEEAAIVSQAGLPGRVTVATNMAGRGTDIKLDPAVREAGGLHVILTEFHESARVDRQLYGRAGRQGDPGTTEAIVALDDELFTRFAPRLLWLARRMPLFSPLLLWMRRAAQARAEAEHAATRREQTAHDRRMEKALAFSGAPE